jgi:hypothetical protein
MSTSTTAPYPFKAIASKTFLHTRNVGVIVPLIHFVAEGVALGFKCAKLSGGKRSMITGGIDVEYFPRQTAKPATCKSFP